MSDALLCQQGPEAAPLRDRCAGCGYSRLHVDLQLCSRCHKVFYCSPQCQRAHWPTHKPDCAAGPAPDPASAQVPEAAEASQVPTPAPMAPPSTPPTHRCCECTSPGGCPEKETAPTGK
eukprot:GAFH01002496.1.p4 GENE.GAFH01002496.1~~GAFH01002496.1.p4  ORF type:complete len:119 (-),score=23.23 GAFH01002496.1:162-518(-)